MTRVEKYKALRTEVAAEIKANALLWEHEQQLTKYQNQLLKINQTHFAPIIKSINEHLNLLNLENSMIKKNYQYLNEQDQQRLKNLLSKIISTLKETKFEEQTPTEYQTLIQYPLEYASLITNVHDKIVQFEQNLASKMQEIELFVKGLEKKYLRQSYAQNFTHSYQEIKTQNLALQEDYQKLKAINRISFKGSFLLFFIITCSLVVIVLLLILIIMIR